MDPAALMAGARETWLEVGFGGGEHMAAQAARAPDVLILGAEPFVNGVASAVRHIDEQGLGNVRLHDGDVRDLCASFQRVVVGTLLDALFDAAREAGARSVGIAGGVSANSRLRRDVAARGAAAGLPVLVPAMSLSTDNAAMIAAAGLRAFRAGVRGEWAVNADASLPLMWGPPSGGPWAG